MENMIARIEQLKQEKDVAIVAHYYVDGQVQDIADYVGDSFALSKIATIVPQKNILFCGVLFMGESAKTLNPKKTVMMPDLSADCPMAHMVTVEDILDVKEKYPDVAVVCYVNSTAEIKAYSDVCVTSSNAVKVVKALPNKDIFFVPDNNLAHFVAKQTPDKNFIFNDGYCHVHKKITTQHIADAKKRHPGVKVLTHPECTEDVLAVSDFIGSTAEIIDYAVIDEHGNLNPSIYKETYFSIRMTVQFFKDVENPIFAYTLKDIKGTEITGTNTMLEKQTLERVKAGDIVTVDFNQKMCLQGANYLLALGCTGYEAGEFTVYCRLYDICNIEVVSDCNTIGYVDMDAKVSYL